MDEKITITVTKEMMDNLKIIAEEEEFTIEEAVINCIEYTMRQCYQC